MRDREGSYLEWASFWCTGYYANYAGYLQQFYSTRHLNGFNALFVDGHATRQSSLTNSVETWGRSN
jgi:prepilin-type processing-associated H-X9-DG protein